MENVYLISVKFIIAISILATLLFLWILKNKKLDKIQMKAVFCVYCFFMILAYTTYYLQNMFYTPHLIMVSSIIFCGISIIVLKFLKLYNSKTGMFFAMFTIFVVQLGYNIYTPFYARQHDSRDFVNYQYGGHFGYIGYIFFNNSLPTGSPKDFWCFYNPPLFHLISALFLKIQTLFGFTIDSGFENLQILSMLYTIIFDIYLYKILREMKIEKGISYLIAFVGLAPAMVIMSGSLNNDILSIMLSTMAIYYTIKWYQEDKLSNLMKIALTISLAMMTKISAALVAIPIACVFFTKILKNKAEIKKYIIHFLIFALVALPIGLWFPVKNLVLYDIPLTYVQSVDSSNGANVSRFSNFERFFKIENESLNTINVVMGEDYNLFITTIKSFIIDEYMAYEENVILNICVYITFFSAIVLSILFICNLIYVIKNYKKINNHWILMFILLFLLSVISYIKFCFDYPFSFTMNFRYIVPTLLSYTVLTGTACENNKKLFYLNNIVITMFCIASVILFMNLV